MIPPCLWVVTLIPCGGGAPIPCKQGSVGYPSSVGAGVTAAAFSGTASPYGQCKASTIGTPHLHRYSQVCDRTTALLTSPLAVFRWLP